jgi:hypothetical protein
MRRTKREVGYDHPKTLEEPTLRRVEVETGFLLKEPSKHTTREVSILPDEIEENFKQLQTDNSIRIGGRLSEFKDNWRKLVNDKWALRIIEEGLRFDFLEIPKMIEIQQYHLSEKDEKILDTEVQEMWQKGVLEETTEPGIDSPMFVVPKKGGTFRPVWDGRYINTFI